MPPPIPDFDHNLVIPPHKGDPRIMSDVSPYPCTTVDLCRKLGTSPERKAILGGFLDFRDRLRSEGMIQGFQWLDGSFLENIEVMESRPPKDLDVVTFFWGYDFPFQVQLSAVFPEFANPTLAKASFSLDHYPVDAGYSPAFTVESARYWSQLFSHNRLGVWKGMLKIELNTPTDDIAARSELLKTTP
jgi:hypothetical protein